VNAADATVLTSNFASKEFNGDDVWEPSTMVSQFGKGRTAYISLGHDSLRFSALSFGAARSLS